MRALRERERKENTRQTSLTKTFQFYVREENENRHEHDNRGPVIAQWICLRLPSCRPGFKSQAHHLCLFSINIVQIVYLSFELECEKKQKETGICPFKKIKTMTIE